MINCQNVTESGAFRYSAHQIPTVVNPLVLNVVTAARKDLHWLVLYGLVSVCIASVWTSHATAANADVDEPQASGAARNPPLVFATSDELPTGALQRFGSERYRVPGWYKSIRFSPDGSSLYVKSDDRLTVLDRATGHAIRDIRINPGTDSVRRIAASLDRELLAVAISDFSLNRQRPNERIVVFNTVQLRRQIFPWPEKRGDCGALGFSQDRKILFAGTESEGLRFWNLANGEVIVKPDLKDLRVVTAAISPDGNTFVVCGRTKSVLWKWLTDDPPQEIAGSSNQLPLTVTFSPDGKSFVIAYNFEQCLHVFDAMNGELSWKLMSPGKGTYPDGGLAFTQDSRLLAVPFVAGNVVELWEMETRQSVQSFATSEPRTVDISRDGRWLAAAGGRSRIDIWNLETGEPMKWPDGHESQLEQIEFTPDDRQLVSASSDGTVRVWDVASGKQIHLLKYEHAEGRPENYVRGLAISPDGKQIVASALDDTVAVWNRATGERLMTLPGQGLVGWSRPIKFSPDGGRFMTWSAEGRIHQWNAIDGQLISTPVTVIPGWHPQPKNAGGGRAVPRGKFAKNGRNLIVEIGKDLFEFDTENGNQIRQLEIDEPVEEFESSPDGEWLVTSHPIPQDPMATVPTNQFRLVIQNHQSLKIMHESIIHGGPIYGLTFSNDSRSIAYNVDGKLIEIVDVPSGKKTASISGIPVCHYLRFSNDGRCLSATQYNETILLWDIEKFAIGTDARLNQKD